MGDEPVFKTEGEYKACSIFFDVERSSAAFECEIEGKKLDFSIELDKNGATVSVRGDGIVALMLPAFSFDGEAYAEIICTGSVLEIVHKDYRCRYSADGKILAQESSDATEMGITRSFLPQETVRSRRIFRSKKLDTDALLVYNSIKIYQKRSGEKYVIPLIQDEKKRK